ncbi:central kinetochore-associated protein [Ophiocordyceps camponoti-floridani]|uniref:Central kinetochore-associated protein n=1 Tax=Ophiocordyceps camponoti-floridani TaxID=2030778 RepID=A0A8H4QA15_9HYPO|nr:central kinetochore-associated protein [Ophiocordyceps camponoti-floridani]
MQSTDGMASSPLRTVQQQELNPQRRQEASNSSGSGDESSAFVSTVGETNASEQENWAGKTSEPEPTSRPTSKASRHSRVLSGTELSPLRILTEQRSSSPETAGTRSPRRLLLEKRFPVKVSGGGRDEATMLPPPVAVVQEPEAAVVENQEQQKDEATDEDDDDDDDDDNDDEGGPAGGLSAVPDEAACPDDTMMSTFSNFSAIPNLTMLARLGGQSPSKLGLSPRGRRDGWHADKTTTTNLLMDFTEQMRFPQGRGQGISPSRPAASTPLRQAANVNLIDLEMPPLPTPRSIPTITPRELDGKEAEVQSLKAAVGDAEKRVGESQEQLREARSTREQLEAERESWEARGRDVEAVLERVRRDMVMGQAERDELEKKLDESEKRREAAEMLHQEAESKMAGMRAGKDGAGAGAGGRPLSLSAATTTLSSNDNNKNSSKADVEAAVEHVARELHALYKTKHDTKVAALKKSYESRWSKKVAALEQQLSDLGAEADALRQQLSCATAAAESRSPDEELRAQAVRDSAAIKELGADVHRLEAVVRTVRRDNDDLRASLEAERVEKGELVLLAEELMSIQTAAAQPVPSPARRTTQHHQPPTSTTTTTTTPQRPTSQRPVQPQSLRRPIEAKTPRGPPAPRTSGFACPLRRDCAVRLAMSVPGVGGAGGALPRPGGRGAVS